MFLKIKNSPPSQTLPVHPTLLLVTSFSSILCRLTATGSRKPGGLLPGTSFSLAKSPYTWSKPVLVSSRIAQGSASPPNRELPEDRRCSFLVRYLVSA